ncbi:hypothetical protein FCK90_08540 [Kocuria coralli]|uniref:Helix-turn-helix domain-containing protein n=1 Tax=Kocuria coralli TaxID=1461025 RepID=A0A5J5KZ26_9MICC|nr:hypothetical protein [Kocuria coralli]KAA9394155.1 hypothetical protein FCK90_08540 [Kocuria coralli]
MSIKAIAWAWQQQVDKSSHKFVLMAIADSSNDFGEAQLSQSYLAWKTELSERVVRDALRALEAGELMTRVRTSRRDGTRGVDGVVLHLEREATKQAWKGISEIRRQLNQQLSNDALPAGEDHGPDITTESTEDKTPSQNHRQNLPVVDSKPVDNSVSPSGNHRQILPVGRDYRQISPNLPADSAGSGPRGHLPTTHARVFYPSSSSVGAQPPVDDDETTTEDKPLGSVDEAKRPPRIHRGVNLSRLRTECAPVAGQWPVDAWAGAVDLILDRTRTRVARPQAYVTGSIRAEPEVLLDASEKTTSSLTGPPAVAAPAEGAQPASGHAPRVLPVRRVSCPIHHTEHLHEHECAGCRADRLAQRPEEG